MYYFKKLFHPPALHQAAQEGNIIKTQKLIAQQYAIDAYNEHGFTPLQYSLLYKHHNVAILLLKAGADPNLECKASCNSGTTIQPYIRNAQKSVIRLLAIYGAIAEEAAFKQKEESLQQIFLEGQIIYRMRLSLNSFRQNSSNPEAFQALQEQLVNALQDCTKKEEDAIFREHYLQLAVDYNNLKIETKNEVVTKPLHSETMLETSLTSHLRRRPLNTSGETQKSSQEANIPLLSIPQLK